MKKDIASKPALLVLAVAAGVALPAMAQDTVRPVLKLQRALQVDTQASSTVVPPPSLARYAPADAVVLKAGPTAAALQGVPIARQFSVQALRATPVVALGADRVDLAPVLRNPRAPFNVAERLRAQPQLAAVTVDETRVVEIPQGLVVHSTLGYRLQPGACNDAGSRARLAEAGARCFSQADAGARAAAFANPGDPRYVADPAQRARLVAETEAKAVQARAEVAQHIASLRAALADPAQRPGIDAAVGAAEAARLASLDDAALEQEMVNRSETVVEQVMFVPARDGIDARRLPRLAAFAAPKAASLVAARPIGLVQPAAAADGNPQGLKVAPIQGLQVPGARLGGIDAETFERALPSRIFLTGFTLGREYEWRQRVQTTVNWCLIGCKATYFAEAFAGFGYGFGLRFPVRVDGTYRYHRVGSNERATLVTNFQPIDGSPADYAASGLGAPQHFDGKELVAEFGAYAGANYSLPVIGSGGISVDAGMDFTSGLPAPFTHGQFRPPMPGQPGPTLTKVFDDFDLAGGQANFGVAGAKVFPAVKVELHSDALRFMLNDRVSGASVPVTHSGQSIPLGIRANTRLSEFTIGDPVYNLGFLVTPGLTARLFVDVSVWSTHWDWPVWFPQLTVQLPPGGVDFACHAGTECRRDYRFGPAPKLEGMPGPIGGKLKVGAPR